MGASGRVTIGNNVFIGMDSIITAGVQIGDNVIIGTGSVVTKNCESNSVYAGCPAKKIMSLDEFCGKRYKAQLEEAKELAVAYFERFGHKPDREVFHEYFMLFASASDAINNDVFSNKLSLCMNRDSSINYMESFDRPFKNFDEFMRCCFDECK